MNKTAIKNFAIWARNKLIADICYRAGLMGITEKGIADPLPQSTLDAQFYDIGAAEPYLVAGEAIKQRRQLVSAIREKEADTDYATAYQYIMEEVAYTWFNRLIAVRFMEVNDYLPSHLRVLSSESGKVEPDLVTTPFDADLPFTAEEEAQIIQWKQDNKLDELFRFLFIKQCNALNEILPGLFEKTTDYTEVLLNLSVVDQEGVVYKLTHDIPEKDFNIEQGGQVEIIGWAYQYYNTEPKAAVFAKKEKYTKEEIPAATQLFTPDWIVRRLIPMECGRLQGFPDGWAEIEPLTDLRELPFWREVYTKDCEIKGKKPNRKMMQADSEEGRRALMRWHDGLHSRAAEYAMWGNGMALPNALFFVKNAFRELGKPPGEIKLGSLFDGSGTMPLCAAMCGGHPVWASEVEPYPIAVTRTHLPHMKHLGSVTEIKGSKIEPVDIITFGSPCQDLSIAGKRAGLKGERSGLFREAIRIIREMLAATNGRYPRFVIWENVPGALSSNGGEDFEVVLNELLCLREFTGGGAAKFIRQHGKWRNFADYGAVAYRIVNAQFWGVPQRRRRIYAICDTCGESAGVVVFERKGTQWNFDPCIPQGGEVAGLTADCYSWHDRMVASKPSGGGQQHIP